MVFNVILASIMFLDSSDKSPPIIKKASVSIIHYLIDFIINRLKHFYFTKFWYLPHHGLYFMKVQWRNFRGAITFSDDLQGFLFIQILHPQGT